jgi:hypothetical protein
MKKILVLISLLLIVSAGVYATTDTVNLKANVPESYEVDLNLGYSLVPGGPYNYDNDDLYNLDLSNPGTVYFSLKNSNRINVGEDQDQFMVDVVGWPWLMKDLEDPENPEPNQTHNLTIANVQATTTSGPTQNIIREAIGDPADAFLFTYTTGITEADMVLGTFEATWSGNSMLSVGDYSSDVFIEVWSD